MHTIDTHYDIQAPLEKVWPFLENFADIQAWWPAGQAVDIERVELEGEGIGQIRHIYNVGFPDAVSEQLDFLDPANHTLKLSLVGKRPAGLLKYQATGQLTALGPNACRITYHSEFVAGEGQAEGARQFLLGAYQLMFQGLEAAAQRRQA
jgi:hypothetical protein